MLHKLNLVRESTATEGQEGNITLAGAVDGWLDFGDAGAVSGRPYVFKIEEGNDFELVEGVWTDSDPTFTLTRATVIKSLIGGVAGTTKMDLGGNATVTVVGIGRDFDELADSYQTKAAVEAAYVPAIIAVIQTRGYSSAGDEGAARYNRVGPEPTHGAKIQSADGAWWELADQPFTCVMFGIIAGAGTAANDAAWEVMNDYIWNHRDAGPVNGGARIRFPSGSYNFTDVVLGITDTNIYDFHMYGDGFQATRLVFTPTTDVRAGLSVMSLQHGSFTDMEIINGAVGKAEAALLITAWKDGSDNLAAYSSAHVTLERVRLRNFTGAWCLKGLLWLTNTHFITLRDLYTSGIGSAIYLGSTLSVIPSGLANYTKIQNSIILGDVLIDRSQQLTVLNTNMGIDGWGKPCQFRPVGDEIQIGTVLINSGDSLSPNIVKYKDPVVAASTGNIDIATGGPKTIDGVGVTAGQRVLVKNQITPWNNGIYQVNAGAWTRTTDCDTADEMRLASVYVTGGNTQAGTQWTCSNELTITLGSTYIEFTKDYGTTFWRQGDATYSKGLTVVGGYLSCCKDGFDIDGAGGVTITGTGFEAALDGASSPVPNQRGVVIRDNVSGTGVSIERCDFADLISNSMTPVLDERTEPYALDGSGLLRDVVTLVGDTAIGITLPTNSWGIGEVIAETGVGTKFTWDTRGGQTLLPLSEQETYGAVNFLTSVLGGTTGGDNAVNISINSGVMYIENRLNNDPASYSFSFELKPNRARLPI